MASSFSAGGSGVGDIPICKNFRFGTCERGAECRYLHSKETTPVAPAELASRRRRPAVHCIVLYASDTKMLQYAKHVSKRFNDAGIGVFLNTDLTEVGLGDPGTGPGQQIKVEHLSTVLRDSPGSGWDYAIVLGDKNMKNGTVQARKSGKLQEVLVDDRIASLLDNWAAQYGITAAPTVTDSERSVSHLSRDQLLDRVQSVLLPSAAHLADRMHKLEATANEVLDARARQLAAWRPPAASPTPSSTSAPRPVPPPLLPTDPSLYSSQDTGTVEKLTRVQTGIVKLYRELAHAAYLLKHVSAQKSAVKSKTGGGASATAAAAFRDLGLGKGCLLDSSHKPAAGAGGGAGAAPVASLPAPLHDKLSSFLRAELQGLEGLGSRLMEATSAMAMWKTSLAQYKQAEQKDKLADFFGDASVHAEPPSVGKQAVVLASVGAGSSAGKPGHAGSNGKDAGVQAEDEFQEQLSGHGRRRKGSVSHDALPSVGSSVSGTGAAGGGFSAASGGRAVPRKDSVDSRGSSAGGWSCSTCTLKNRAGTGTCEACGAEMPASQWAPVGPSQVGGSSGGSSVQPAQPVGAGVRVSLPGKGPAPGTLAAVVAGISPGKSDGQRGKGGGGLSLAKPSQAAHNSGTGMQQPGKKQAGSSAVPAPASTVLSQASKTTPVSSHGSVLTTSEANTVLPPPTTATPSLVSQSQWPGLPASAAAPSTTAAGSSGERVKLEAHGKKEGTALDEEREREGLEALVLPTAVDWQSLPPPSTIVSLPSAAGPDRASTAPDQAALLWQALQAQALKASVPATAGANAASRQSQLQAQAAALASLQTLQMQVQQQQAQISTLLKLNQTLAMATAGQQQAAAQQQQQQQQQRAMVSAAMAMGSMPAPVSHSGGLGLGLGGPGMGQAPSLSGGWAGNLLSMPGPGRGPPPTTGTGTGGGALGLAMPQVAGTAGALGLGSLSGLSGLQVPGGLGLPGPTGSAAASNGTTQGSASLLGLESPPHAVSGPTAGAGGSLMPGLTLGMGSLGLGGPDTSGSSVGSIAGLDVSFLQSLGLLPPPQDTAQQARGYSGTSKGAAFPCAVCGAPSSLSCDSCASEPPYLPTYYCSAQHQGQDWARHKAKHSK